MVFLGYELELNLVQKAVIGKTFKKKSALWPIQ